MVGNLIKVNSLDYQIFAKKKKNLKMIINCVLVYHKYLHCGYEHHGATLHMFSENLSFNDVTMT